MANTNNIPLTFPIPDLVGSSEKTIKLALDGLKEVRKEYKGKEINSGLCVAVYDKILSTGNGMLAATTKYVIQIIFPYWPKYSGNSVYPIEVLSWNIPLAAQYSEQFALPSNFGPCCKYRKLRRQLLNFCIATLKKELSARQDLAERQLIAEHDWDLESKKVQDKYWHYRELLKQKEELHNGDN